MSLPTHLSYNIFPYFYLFLRVLCLHMFQLSARKEPVVDSTKYTAADVRIVSQDHHFYHLISNMIIYWNSFLIGASQNSWFLGIHFYNLFSLMNIRIEGR